MKICLDKNNIDREKYVLIEKDAVSHLVESPLNKYDDVVFYGTRQFEYLLNIFLPSSQADLITFPALKYRKSFDNVVKSQKTIPWKLALPEHLFDHELDCFIQLIQGFLKTVDEKYFNAQREISFFLSQLKPAHINVDKLDEYYFDPKHVAQKSILETFKPGPDGFAPKILYTNADTRTGRLKIVSGPSILHLKKELRDVLSSRHGDEGEIFYLDYKSLEPRTLLIINLMKEGLVKNIDNDVYQYFLNELKLDIPREAVKIALLSNLYGQHKSKTAEQLRQWTSDPFGFLQLVDKYFKIEQTKEELQKEYLEHNRVFVKNYFGRPLYTEQDYVLLNYFVQSTAADIALMGFANIFNKIKKINMFNFFTPLFILHDALIVDVHKDVMKHLDKIIKLGETIDGFEGFIFPLECSSI